MANSRYTEKQLKIINGEISMDTVDGRALRWLYDKALSLGDYELAQKVKCQLEIRKDEYSKQNKERAKQRVNKIRRNEEIQWKQPKSNNYTDHHKKIIRGEISYEKIHTYELVSFYLKARNNGDYELSERIFDLIKTRQAEERARQKERKNKCKQQARDLRRVETLLGVHLDVPLTLSDKVALISEGALSEETEARLDQAMETLKTQGNQNAYSILAALILYKKDPRAFNVVNDHWEAINLIEALLGLPIRRPQTWFCNEHTKREDG